MKKFMELLFLKSLKGLGNATINKKYIHLLEKTNSFEECVELVYDNEPNLTSIDIEKAVNVAKKKHDDIFNDLEISVITVFDEEYPKKLLDLKDKKPLILYVKGDVSALAEPNIAIVGTRKPSEWSMKVESRLVHKIIDLSERTIVSGLALGCDKIAHETTVNLGKKTIAVLPSGVKVITPATHKALAESIIKNGGCLISEYEPTAKVTKSTYVERDAIIAALSDATMVVECGVKSGTMHTVDAAEQMKRKLACYYIADSSKGTYDGNEFMIKEKGAYKISDTTDLVPFLEELNKKEINEEPEAQQMSITDILGGSTE